MLNVYSRLLTLIAQNPELKKHRERLTGGCCRRPKDKDIIRRIRAYLELYPELRPLLGSLVEPPG
jgi:hypothetical protein